VLSGHAEAGSSVKVMDAATGETICRDNASAAGAFSCSPAAAMPGGEHHVTASATDEAGNVSLVAEAVSVIISDTVPPPPSIDSPANGTELEQRRPVIQGRTLAGTLVEVSVDGTVFAAQVAGDGQWTLHPPADLSLGTHLITASAVDPAQNVSDPAASRFGIVETGVARGGCASGGVPAPLLALVALLLAAARRRRSLSILGALAIVAAPALVQAQQIDVSLFKPAAGGDGLAAVEGARPPIAGEPRLELRTWTDYAVRPLTFVSSSGQEQALVRGRLAQWLGVQVHLLGPLSVAAQIPMTLAERGDLSRLPPSSRGPSQLLSGFADVRLTPRLSLLRQEWAGIDLATQLSFEFPTARAQSLSSDGSVRAEGLVALGRSLGAVPAGTLELLANAYLRLRPARDFLDVKSGTEAGLRAGLEYGIDRVRAWVPRRVYAELEARSFLRAGFAAGSAPAEWRLGGTVCPVGNLAVDLAGGSALSNGVGAPRARFLLGFGWSPAACGRSTDALLAASTPAPQPVAAPAEPPPRPTPVAQALQLPPPPMVVDRDGDGIADADDACPDHAGSIENHGCPPGIPQRVIVSATSLEILDRVHFATGQARIEKRSYPLLDQVAAVIQSHPHLLLIQVEGHTDDRGGAAYNILLSQARATAVADYLISKGVERDRLVARGYGPTRPVDSNGTLTGRAANRRVAFTVVKTEARVIDAERPPDS
jgi:MYXO-CTERM domain-containing protein